MDNPLQIVTIAGVERELLYTLSLYRVLQEKNQPVVIEKDATWADVNAAMLRMMYAAYLNAIRVRQIDEPSYNPERAKYMDFVIWSEQQPTEFAKQLKLCYKFITGEDLVTDDLKKKIQPKEEKAKLPKTSIWKWIGEKFKTF